MSGAYERASSPPPPDRDVAASVPMSVTPASTVTEAPAIDLNSPSVQEALNSLISSGGGILKNLSAAVASTVASAGGDTSAVSSGDAGGAGMDYTNAGAPSQPAVAPSGYDQSQYEPRPVSGYQF